jgi:hypothetical protein
MATADAFTRSSRPTCATARPSSSWTSSGLGAEVRSRLYARRVTEDVRSADESGVAGTPTFFVNGRRHQGAYDVETLTAAIHLARHRYKIDAASQRARQSGN